MAMNSTRTGRRGSIAGRRAGGAAAVGTASAAATKALAARSAGASAAAIPKSDSNRRQSWGCECRMTTRTAGASPRISSAASRLSTSLDVVSTAALQSARPAASRDIRARKSPRTIRAPAAVARSSRSPVVRSSVITVTPQPRPRSDSTTCRPNRPSPHTTTACMDAEYSRWRQSPIGPDDVV